MPLRVQRLPVDLTNVPCTPVRVVNCWFIGAKIPRGHTIRIKTRGQLFLTFNSIKYFFYRDIGGSILRLLTQKLISLGDIGMKINANRTNGHWYSIKYFKRQKKKTCDKFIKKKERINCQSPHTKPIYK